MTAPQTSSRLQLLQARFQQRQLQEKEQKLLQLYDQQQQRAHQIALRGSTRSNDPDISNYESFISNSGKARQIFDEKRQTKGIDKSYPLEPLDKRAHKPATDARTIIGTRRTSRNEQQRDNLSGRGIYRESVLRDSCGASRTEDSVDRGNDNEINIKEVIDSESAQRNRIPSRFGPLDLERRSQLDRLPGDASPEKMPVRRTSQVERLKNASSRKGTKKPAIPTGANLGVAKHFSSDSITKRADTSGKIAESRANREKEPIPYPSLRSPENTYEQRSRPPVKSISLKFLNQIVAGEASTAGDCELGFRETSAPSIDALYVQPKDEKGAASTPQAAKQPTKPLATNASMGSSRGQIPTNACNLNLKAKSNLTIPTPVQKSNTLKNITNTDDSLVRCNVCNRRFSMERINFHQDICSKTVQKKRKQFDTVKQRVKGTEFESFLKKPLGKKQIKSVSRVEPEPHIVKSNWRRKHEDFINAIRSAKQMQVHLASGGKLSDLAISPPSDNSDYVKCPHCSRRFSQTVASRHIPKCNSMQSNKPGLRNTFKAKH